MTFAPTEEQRQLQQLVRKFCEAKSPVAEVRRLMDTEAGFDPAVWHQLGSELGLQSLAIPERFGGAGFSLVELCLAMEEMGRALLCAPFLSSIVLGANVILVGGTEDNRERLLPAIASGDLRAALAFAERTDAWAPYDIATEAIVDGAQYRLHGAKTLVVDGHTAQLIIVSARRPGTGAVSLFTVDASNAEGLRRTSLPTLDQTRKLAELRFEGTPAQLLGGPDDDGAAALRRTLQRAAVCLAAEQLGGAAHCLDASVEYAKMRTQFGRPIGSFQAIKHRCADMLLDVESARSAAYSAMASAADDTDVALASSLAHAYCSEVFSRSAGAMVQIHGGVGYTWEHDAHLYLKRAKASEALLGGIDYHRDVVAASMNL
ncbi:MULTISPECIES: acyl-CoA dehydrogenase family protein [Mycolicibacterium]|uniref:Acyl-CoA dehydrogenase n=2 Tax=Mycolicibacterium TaxID=1866885 RepID=A0AAD1H6G4_9MYCO|nr:MULTISPECIES: acyl-CoA dehydrogenase family protein [Mycolicibacterium]MCV7042482.1 acyl-CoA/acyl-ACP dehydrogenase [Mycolicibacterium moriokaense]MCV7057773.1 acyl-CoA/acyl-ACP dehydrogenase [Mycolicibacterium gilvum]ORB14090.1 acyl-CoA dehydrogenase [Mycolicibacterium moriokaense]STZ41113.1 acyl-CoA dehydrogenase [Mycolicibacterium gilvum]BBW99155.1 acyl-CoA dehydrogenase [Mycolicibacterium moriokaense]